MKVHTCNSICSGGQVEASWLKGSLGKGSVTSYQKSKLKQKEQAGGSSNKIPA
jgi:hypothetical protein